MGVLALYYAVQRMVIVVQKMYERRKEAQELEKEKSELLGKRKSGKGFFRRLQKTVQRWIKKIPGFGDPEHPPFMPEAPQADQDVRAGDKEQAERLERERAAEEAERRLERERQEQFRKDKEAYEEKQREKQKAEADARKAALDAAAEELAEKEGSAPTLTVQRFKELWTTLTTSGSFQCKLKESPDLNTFLEHLKKQGFHIVFASSPATGDIEVGLCNIRTPDDDGKVRTPWFSARMLCSQNNFSAVMKAQDPASVPVHVKKFSLAKILKIQKGK